MHQNTIESKRNTHTHIVKWRFLTKNILLAFVFFEYFPAFYSFYISKDKRANKDYQMYLLILNPTKKSPATTTGVQTLCLGSAATM